MRTAGWEVLASGWCPAPPQCTPGHLVVPGLLVVMEEVLAEELDDEEQLVRRHRKEKKELQAKIQGMKNAVPKNDKKRRKQLTEEVAKLEKEMEQKHREELEHLKLASKENKIDSVAVNISNMVLESQPPRISKAQKRREKKAALEKEREERIAEAETENLSGARCREAEKLAQILAARELEIKQIPSDGHCMYRALEDQLRDQDCALTVPALRKQTADYMQSHAEDFLPFLTNPSTGDMYTPEEFGKYCEDIVNTAAWGGQLELRALSHILQTPIEILQADSPPIIVGEEYPKNPLILVYMRHAYGLGEHYNSVTRSSPGSF
ncbi:deubiquitinase OTUD6B isoform X3 [Nannospalax galili]|uniref:deubiquitinase OTUD6B isoform X3 n=1 Tax=Nannospalax galili TaxID=1026970 RepID=UPI00111C20B5|nr:deubiquitinase OTUD6B isoform X3 [Nannospalax galili]